MEKEKIKLPVLSYSKVNTYESCPKKYKFAYIDKLPRQDKSFTIFGSFCHEVLETFHRYYLNEATKDLEYVEAMQKAFNYSISKWKEKITIEQLNEAYSIMMDYLMIFFSLKEEERPIILSVEQKIWTPINDEIIFYGYIDRVQKDKDGVLHIIDYKTTKDPKYLKDRTQLLLYGYSLFVDDDSVDKVRTSYILLKHKMRYMTKDHNIDELIAAKDALLIKWREIIEDKLFRAKPSFMCRYCDYIQHCEDGNEKMYKEKKYIGKINW
jgi:putative RecB family exonuclease